MVHTTKDTWIEEVHLGVEVEGIVFNRSTCEGKAVVRLKKTHCLVSLGEWILNRLAFVEYSIFKGDLRELLNVVGDHSVGREDDVVL